ncbi:MAG: NMD3-related protein [Nanoarchaeota archaeon]
MAILEGYSELEIVYCANCRSFLYKGKYIPLRDFKRAFPKLLKEHVQFSVEPDAFNVDSSVVDNPAKNVKVPICVTARINEETIEEEAVMEIRFKQAECPYCSRLKGGYYEGVLQLRNRDNTSFNEVAEEITKNAEMNNTVAITSEKDVKGGKDYYITDKKYMQHLSNELYNKYGGEKKESPRLYGFDRQSSKKLYRLNILLRLANVEPGDVVEWNSELFKVLAVRGNKVNVESLMSSKTRPLKIDEIKKRASKSEYIQAVVVKPKPDVVILHPREYINVTLQNNPAKIAEKIHVVEIDGKFYAV